MTRSQIVQALADLASQGRYSVDPAGARNMTALYEAVAGVINSLEAEEAAPVDADIEEAIADGETQ